ncbi:hypothetical protein ACWKWN_18375 [Microbacterium trichothecenolyticum]
MSETPIARLSRWWVTRRDRPSGEHECGARHCHNNVLEGEGYWLPNARAVVCSQDCADFVSADLRA